MITVLKLIGKDLKRLLNDLPALLLTFAVPAVLIIIFGSIFGGGSGSRGKIPILVLNQSDSEIAKMIETEIDSSSALRPVKTIKDEEGNLIDITEEKAIELVKGGSYPAALIFPAEFLSDTSTGLKFKYYYDPRNEIESSLIQGAIQQTIYTEIPAIFPKLLQKKAEELIGDTKADSFRTNLAETISSYFNVDKNEILESMSTFNIDSMGVSDGGDELNIIDQLIQFDSEQLVGKEIKNPGVTRIVGGWAIMFLLFSLTGAATSLFEEKQEGSLKRLLCMPIKRSHILWSKYFYSMLLGIVQLFVLFFFAWIIYDVQIFSNFINLLIVIFASSSAAVAFGMIITATAKSLSQANGIATLFILIMSAIGGSWFPVTLFPEWIQAISKFTLTYWSVEAFLQVLWRGADLSGIALHLGILFGIAIPANYIALYLFKKNRVV